MVCCIFRAFYLSKKLLFGLDSSPSTMEKGPKDAGKPLDEPDDNYWTVFVQSRILTLKYLVFLVISEVY